jgi:hypothetical protein
MKRSTATLKASPPLTTGRNSLRTPLAIDHGDTSIRSMCGVGSGTTSPCMRIPFDVELNCLPDELPRFFQRRGNGNATGKIGNVRTIAAGGRFEKDRVGAHSTSLTPRLPPRFRNRVSELPHRFEVPFNGLFHQFARFIQRGSCTDASGEVRHVRAISCCGRFVEHGVSHCFVPF